MANADADRISLDLKSNFAAIAAARPIPHLELLCPFLMAVSRTTRGHDPAMTAKRRSAPFDRSRSTSAQGQPKSAPDYSQSAATIMAALEQARFLAIHVDRCVARIERPDGAHPTGRPYGAKAIDNVAS
jgi:hypothetical protein